MNLLRTFPKFLGQGKNTDFNRGKCRVETENGSLISSLQFFHIICCTEEGQSYSVRTERRLYNIRNIMLIRLIVKITHILTGNLFMLGKVIIGSVRNPPKFAPTEGEEEFQVCCGLGIERKFCLLMIPCTKHFFLHA